MPTFDSRTADGLAIAHAYATGTSDPVEVLDAALAQASSVEHVFIELTAERARREAQASAARWKAGQPLSALDGVPIAWKDLFDMNGSVTTAGAAVRRKQAPAAADAWMVQQLARGGMVSLGKTNMSEFAYSGLGLNPHFGTPLNPHSREARVPGGSSSGSGVAVAAGVVPIAMGTDTGGSIRIPSAFNGLVGYRSSRQRYDFTGVFPLARSLDCLGPLTRSVRDAIAVDQLLLGGAAPAIADPRTLLLRVDPATLADERVEPAVRDNFEACLARLEQAGARIDRRPLPVWHDTLDSIQRQGWLGAAEAFALHEQLLDSSAAEQLDPRVRVRLEAARRLPASQLLALYGVRAQLQARVQEELNGALLVTPTVAHVAPLLDPLLADSEAFVRCNLATLRLTMPGSLLDMPGVALPSGVDAQGLPTSLLLSLPAGDDLRLLGMALAVEHALN